MAIKTEHSGAKNGGGFWGRRKAAKQISKKLRREAGKAEVDHCDDCEAPGATDHLIPADSDGGFGSPETERALCDRCARELGLKKD